MAEQVNVDLTAVDNHLVDIDAYRSIFGRAVNEKVHQFCLSFEHLWTTNGTPISFITKDELTEEDDARLGEILDTLTANWPTHQEVNMRVFGTNIDEGSESDDLESKFDGSETDMDSYHDSSDGLSGKGD
jgi:hypothetical protein